MNNLTKDIIQNSKPANLKLLNEPIPLFKKEPAEPYSNELLPNVINDWILDVSERTGFPPDFMFASTLVSTSSILSHRFKICPKQYDDTWVITPNLWGALIGEPSTGKSPMLKYGIAPLSKIQDANSNLRLIARDTTVEKLGEILKDSQRPILLYRDELDGWLTSLNKAGRETDRAFYLESFNGDSQYSFDRIARGSIHINSLNISILGGIQPARINQYIQESVNHKSGDDGLLQRFQITVWPDDNFPFKLVDRKPDYCAQNATYKRVCELFERTQNMKKNIVLKFSRDAQELFNNFIIENRNKTNSNEIHSSFKAHLTKYEGMVPSLALIIEALNSGDPKTVELDSMNKALKISRYLESHARKMYSYKTDPIRESANLILQRKEKLNSPFKVRDIQQKGWVGLSSTSNIKKAIKVLVEHNYLKSTYSKASNKGRPQSAIYQWIN